MTMICYIYKYSLLFFTTHNITVKEVLGNYWKQSGIPSSMYGTNCTGFQKAYKQNIKSELLLFFKNILCAVDAQRDKTEVVRI